MIYYFPSTSLLSGNSYSSKKVADVKKIVTAVYKIINRERNIGIVVDAFQTTHSITLEVMLDYGVRVNEITQYATCLSEELECQTEFEIPLKGTSNIGIHLSFNNDEGISIKEVLESEQYNESEARIPLILGTNISGEYVIEDLDEIGHLLIAGASGAGKSVLLNDLILGFLYKHSPDELRLVLVDLGLTNLVAYEGILSLLLPVVTECVKAEAILSWCNNEIKNRYRKLESYKVKNIDDFNTLESKEKIPHVVIVIDEFGQLITKDNRNLEYLLEIARSGKAAGIHLIIATHYMLFHNTYKMIKDTISSRVVFNVMGIKESYSLLDQPGAEELPPVGECLFVKPGNRNLAHIKTANMHDSDPWKVSDFLRENNKSISEIMRESQRDYKSRESATLDSLLYEAGFTIIEKNKASIGMLQRLYRIGFNRANTIMNQLADLGVVGPEEGIKPREILMNKEELLQLMNKQ